MTTPIIPKPQKDSRWQEHEEPWYQQFWPWFLIALPGSVVIAGLSTLYIANRYS
ncbi:FixH family protein, partial [Congregibacter sp.]